MSIVENRYPVDFVIWWPFGHPAPPYTLPDPHIPTKRHYDYRDFDESRVLRRAPIKRRGHWIFSKPDGEDELARLRDWPEPIGEWP